MTPEAASRRLERFAAEMPGAADRGLSEVLKFARERAIWWSSGPFSGKALRAMYNPKGPYSKAEPHPPADAARINIRSGDLMRGWAFTPISANGGKRSASLYNVAPEAGYMGHWDGAEWVQGPNSAMIGRPLPLRVMDEIEPKARELLGAEMDRMGG
jgi:hypothetical protein